MVPKPPSGLVLYLELSRRLVAAELKLAQITSEHHLASHMAPGKKKDWTKCWNPICREARLAMGDAIDKYVTTSHFAERKRKNEKRKAKKELLKKNGV